MCLTRADQVDVDLTVDIAEDAPQREADAAALRAPTYAEPLEQSLATSQRLPTPEIGAVRRVPASN